MASKDYIIQEKQEDGSLLTIHPETKAKNVIESSEKQFISQTEKEKLSGIENQAEKNKIQTISVNGVKTEIDSERNVNLIIANEAGVELEYNQTTGEVSLLNESGEVLSKIDLPLELLIESGNFNSETKNIELVLANGDKILIPASDLVNEYNADNVTIVKSENNIFSVSQTILDKITQNTNNFTTNANEISSIKNGDVIVGKAKIAEKLEVERTIDLIGNVNGSANFDGSKDIEINVELEDIGEAGAYSAVLTDSKGRVTQGGQVIEVGTTGQTTPSSNLVVGGLFFQEVE